MELRDVLYQMMQQNAAAMQPADLCFGTVTQVRPLQISLSAQTAPLEGAQLVLTSAVVERKLPALAHSHTTAGLAHSHALGGLSHSHTADGIQTSGALSGSYQTETALTQDDFQSDAQLESVACVENGSPLPADGGFITLNRALAAGDRVLLLRVQHGQKYVVLSRVFEGES